MGGEKQKTSPVTEILHSKRGKKVLPGEMCRDHFVSTEICDATFNGLYFAPAHLFHFTPCIVPSSCCQQVEFLHSEQPSRALSWEVKNCTKNLSNSHWKTWCKQILCLWKLQVFPVVKAKLKLNFCLWNVWVKPSKRRKLEWKRPSDKFSHLSERFGWKSRISSACFKPGWLQNYPGMFSVTPFLHLTQLS